MKHAGHPRVIGFALACAGAILGTIAPPSLAAEPSRPLVVAHRGGAALMPENTFPAFDNAVRLGVDLLEFDMQMTVDNQLVISHDGTVNSTFCVADPGSGAVPGPIRAMLLADVLKFDCGSKHRAIYPAQKAVPGTHMPTPDAFFARYAGSHVQFYGETKMPGAGEGDVDPVAFTRLIAAVVHKYGLEDRFILQSADYRTIDVMHELNPRIRTCLLYPWLAKADYLELAKEHHATCMLLRLQDADVAEVKRLREAGVMIFSDVVDDAAGWRNYLARGVDALFTNDPAALIAFLKQLNVRERQHPSGLYFGFGAEGERAKQEEPGHTPEQADARDRRIPEHKVVHAPDGRSRELTQVVKQRNSVTGAFWTHRMNALAAASQRAAFYDNRERGALLATWWTYG